MTKDQVIEQMREALEQVLLTVETWNNSDDLLWMQYQLPDLIAAAKAVEPIPSRKPLTEEQIAELVGDEYHRMTAVDLLWFRLGELAHGITAENGGQL